MSFFEQFIFVSFGVQNGIRFKSFHYLHCESEKNWTLLLQASVLFFEQLIIIFVSFGVQNGIRFKSFHYIHCVSEKNWTLLHLSITLTNNNFNNFL